MATGLTDSAHYQGIANAIRAKNGSTETYAPGEMAAAVRALEVADPRTVVNMDYSLWGDGQFTALMDDGTSEPGTVTFVDGKPTSVTLFGRTVMFDLPEVE